MNRIKRHKRLALWVVSAVMLFVPHATGWAAPPAQIPAVKGYRVQSQSEQPVPVSGIAKGELERVLGEITQMSGMRSLQMPPRYWVFRFPSPVVLNSSPIGHPVREVAVIPPSSATDEPRLLVKNTQNQWVEYKTARPLSGLLSQMRGQAGHPHLEKLKHT
ncbi:hypothetical protein GCM10011571_12910 [Marinithermofilum abyssi]|uniref:Uncharacterized protein n=1 Tax=Marinithermofilum abyssi TaxID=1571185 RepID=A0A8J2YCX3_9BACL|nr:hypothetical protein [Marinithermofilum abyssi]GGE12935.1 hypothetical protein GCM10011571_12910 [Marinithermofilum abyssi]